MFGNEYKVRLLGTIAILIASLLAVSPSFAESNSMSTKEKTEKIVQELKSRTDSMLIRVDAPASAAQKGPGICNLLVYAGQFRIESPSYRNGVPTSADVQISAAQLKSLVDVLAAQGLFEKSQKFHSNRSEIDKKFPPPKDSKEFQPSQHTHGGISITTNDDHWYTYYDIAFSEGQAASNFSLCSEVVSDKAKQYLIELAKKSK